jgi:formylglycine-generating enzyme required for sulfatase activity
MNPSADSGDRDGACGCGAPGREQLVAFGRPASMEFRSAAAGQQHTVAQAHVPAGTFTMGDSSGDGNRGDGETPQHLVDVTEFRIDATAVTNDDFARLVNDTGFRTDAERRGYSAVFHLALCAPDEDVIGRAAGTPWWLGVRGADWAHPGGLSSSIEHLGDHPVVHVSWNDAIAYCEWAGRRLPSEAEWEYAARGGLEGKKYPWGDDEVDEEGWRANIFQGEFPSRNTVEDGWLTTAPVRAFAPNGRGLWQTVGNVWEWCQDWFDPRYYGATPSRDPRGPDHGTARVMRGGSYLCHLSYCNRYRNSARSSNTPDSSMGNTGFRTVAR